MLKSLVYLGTGNAKKSKKVMKIVNIDKENIHIFRKIKEISMKFQGECVLCILKVSQKQGCTFTP